MRNRYKPILANKPRLDPGSLRGAIGGACYNVSRHAAPRIGVTMKRGTRGRSTSLQDEVSADWCRTLIDDGRFWFDNLDNDVAERTQRDIALDHKRP